MRAARVRTLGVRNLAAGEVELGGAVTLLWGANGAGKTTMLEAICMALTGRSPRTRREREIIAFGGDLARAEVDVVDRAETRTFLWSHARSGERRHLLDGSAAGPDRLALRPALSIFLPDRLALVKGPPSTRRNHIDGLAAALWPARRDLRSRYGQALAQRNGLLHRVRAGTASPASLDAWDHELASTGAALIASRAETVARLTPEFARAVGDLGLPGDVHLAYRPRCERGDPDGIVAELAQRRDSDVARGFSGHGPHLDDVAVVVGGRQVRRYGSQGEQRTALLGVLFAERRALHEAGRPLPLMLLDDVMSELDPERRELLAARLVEGGGQAVVTATEAAHLPSACPRDELAVREGAIAAAARPQPGRLAA